MDSVQLVKDVLWGRIGDLEKAKAEGRKVVGYFPSEYMPEELVLASGAIPLGLAKGGDNAAVENTGPYLPRWMDTFSRAQLGYMLMKYDPHYQIVDLYVFPMVDVANAYSASAMECWTDLDIFKFEVPHEKTDRARQYYLDSIYRLKDKLESVTGKKITDAAVKEAIDLCNRERNLLRELTTLRKAKNPPINGIDFAKMVHASYVADKASYIKMLENVLKTLKGQEGISLSGPRILLTGPTLASGDYKIHSIVNKLGGDIVIEQYSEGLRDYWQDVSVDGDPMEALADRYMMKKIAHGVFTPARERLEFIVNLAKDFKVDGVIWYQTMYKDAFDMEAIYFPEILKEGTGISPMLKIETDYDPTETGAFRTRIEAYFELITA